MSLAKLEAEYQAHIESKPPYPWHLHYQRWDAWVQRKAHLEERITGLRHAAVDGRVNTSYAPRLEVARAAEKKKIFCQRCRTIETVNGRLCDSCAEAAAEQAKAKRRLRKSQNRAAALANGKCPRHPSRPRREGANYCTKCLSYFAEKRRQERAA